MLLVVLLCSLYGIPGPLLAAPRVTAPQKQKEGSYLYRKTKVTLDYTLWCLTNIGGININLEFLIF